MEVILKETIDTLGQEGDIVKVRNGYGRNYLIPQQKAMLATPGNRAILEQNKAAIEARRQQMQEESEALAKKVAGASVTIEQRVGEEDKLYGSVTSADIAARLAALGVNIDRKKILLDEPIKTVGVHMVPVKVGFQMNADLKVEIVPLAAAEAQAE